jgi:hypothetical protein
MPSRSASRRTPITVVAATIVAVVVLGCGPTATPPTLMPPTVTPPSATSPAPATTPTPPTPSPSPSLAGRDAPPDAVLAAEGGDPVTGQLGTYVWFGTGSDAPWLTGAPLTVGGGEPLYLRVVPEGRIAAWEVRDLPAGAVGPEEARTIAKGTGAPAFEAPGSGTWTVEVTLEFAGGAGRAAYFWRLKVE